MTGDRSRRVLPWALLALLLCLRLPSLVQPLGPDQSLYAYVAQEIGRGGWPYLDAWDQKPPGVHLLYAGLFAVWPDDAAVAFGDLAAAGLVAALLVPLGAWWGSRGAGWTAAALFLVLGDPNWQRLGGLRVRGQCEVFIGLAITAAVWLAVRHQQGTRPAPALAAASGLLIGVAALFKYPAAIYGLVPLLILAWPAGDARTWARGRSLAALVAGAALPPLAMVVLYGAAGGLRDLVDATVVYNLRYSGTTYEGPAHFLRYLATFPVRHARVDGLWLTGGAGAIVLAAGLRREPRFLLVFAWLACAMVAIAINGSRGLPQYFLQAAPAWALAAGLGLAAVWTGRHVLVRAAIVAVLAVSVARVVELDNPVRAIERDVRVLLGRDSYRDYLAAFGERRGDKFRLASTWDLAGALARRTRVGDRIYVFGFANGAYVYSQRRSASRFFWSSPLVDGFNDGQPGYGAQGLLESLQRTRPAAIAVQTDPPEMAAWFWRQPALSAWVRANYQPAPSSDLFELWVPRVQ
jgi:hypothetical protein